MGGGREVRKKKKMEGGMHSSTYKRFPHLTFRHHCIAFWLVSSRKERKAKEEDAGDGYLVPSAHRKDAGVLLLFFAGHVHHTISGLSSAQSGSSILFIRCGGKFASTNFWGWKKKKTCRGYKDLVSLSRRRRRRRSSRPGIPKNGVKIKEKGGGGE